MDGRGRVFDNIFVERLWRTVKYEEVYLKDYGDLEAARQALKAEGATVETVAPLFGVSPSTLYRRLTRKSA